MIGAVLVGVANGEAQVITRGDFRPGKVSVENLQYPGSGVVDTLYTYNDKGQLFAKDFENERVEYLYNEEGLVKTLTMLRSNGKMHLWNIMTGMNSYMIPYSRICA